MKSPYHIIKCQCTKKQRAFFSFFGRNKTGFFTYETPHTFSFISPPISAPRYSATGISYRDQTSLDLTLTSLEQRRTWDKSQHRIWASLFRFQWALLCATLSRYCQHFREFINEQHNHLLALNTNKHSTSTEEPFQTQSQGNNLFSAFENWCTRTMISNPDNFLLQILLTQCS